MQKLTKEQAEWLNAAMKDLYLNNHPNNEAHNFALDMKDIINQCTEKEFPEFKIIMEGSGRHDLIHVTNKAGDNEDSRECENVIFINVDNGPWDTQSFVMMEWNEFKQFTENCNKIVEWLDEQENN